MKINLPWDTVYATSTSELFHPVTGWMPAPDQEEVQFTIELRNPGPNIQACPGYQTANVENSPDTHVKIGSLDDTEGVAYPDGFTDISANTAGKRLVRYGWVTALSTGSVLEMVRVAGVGTAQRKS